MCELDNNIIYIYVYIYIYIAYLLKLDLGFITISLNYRWQEKKLHTANTFLK
jgi:hypothetical protein